MEKFEVNILGCGSAVPTARHNTTAQLVNIHEKLFLVDCGEGTQKQLWSQGIRTTNLNHIFISHMHGDHFFGLLPLLSSLGLMLNRSTDLHLYLPTEMQEPLQYDIEKYCYLPYQVIFHPIDTKIKTVLYEDKVIIIESIPLHHRVPCCGFLFKEKSKANVLLPDRCRQYGIPPQEFGKIKNGADYRLPNGTIVPNSELTALSDFVPRTYAYCSDTAYYPAIIEQIKEATLLYHEATFIEEDAAQAESTAHSTSRQAAMIARDAGVHQLAIGHYSIRYEDENTLLSEAQSVFPNTIATQEGLYLSSMLPCK